MCCLALFLVTFLAPVAVPAPPPASVSSAPLAALQDDLDALLRERVRDAGELSLEALWQRARDVSILVGDEVGPAFDAAVERLLDDEAPRSSRTTLLLVAMRLLGDDVDFELLASELRPLLHDADTEVAVAAATMLDQREIQDLDDLRGPLASELMEIAADGDREPRVRIACAVTTHHVGFGNQIHAAQRLLFDFMKSSDPELVARGALALAGLGLVEDVAGVEGELERLATLPGPDGELAKAYLTAVNSRRLMETRLRRERARSQDMLGSGEPGSHPELALVGRVIDLVQQLHLEGDHFTREQLVEAALNGLLHSLDRHSAYFSSEQFKRFEQDLEAEYGGIGAYVQSDPTDSLFTITRPIYSGPAYRAGLGTDDKIVRVGDWPTVGEDVEEVIKRLKGRPGTPVKLYVWRQGMDPGLIERPSEDMSVTLERDRIVIPPVYSDYLPGDVGLLELTTFSRVASDELQREIEAMKARGMRALVLDLRNNTGGLLSEARNVADLFLPPGEVVVRTESRIPDQSTEFRTSEEPVVPADMPVVVLINRFSASAAEIVSGALQDHGRAKLVGKRSFGKGSVQNLFPAPGEHDDEFADENGNQRWDSWETITRDWNGNGEFDFAPRVKLTIERYLLPTGRSIHRELDEEGNIVSEGGIEPDLDVDTRRWEPAELEQIVAITRSRKVREWVHERFEGDPEALERLALTDHGDPDAYPGFEEFYAGLDTSLPRDDVRFLARREVRRLVQDLRGHSFPQGDFQEDLQLQAALRLALEELGRDAAEVEAYRDTFAGGGPTGAAGEPVASVDAARLDAALSLLAEARGAGGQISEEALRELSDLLKSLGRRN